MQYYILLNINGCHYSEMRWAIIQCHCLRHQQRLSMIWTSMTTKSMVVVHSRRLVVVGSAAATTATTFRHPWWWRQGENKAPIPIPQLPTPSPTSIYHTVPALRRHFCYFICMSWLLFVISHSSFVAIVIDNISLSRAHHWLLFRPLLTSHLFTFVNRSLFSLAFTIM